MLLPKEYMNAKGSRMDADIEEEQRALLSVVVESSEAKLFVIKQTHVNLLPFETKHKLYQRIATGSDSDRPGSLLEIDRVKKVYKMWRRYKVSLNDMIYDEAKAARRIK